MKNTKIKILLGGVVLLAFANIFLWQEVLSVNSNLEVTFFDIGQGDSIFIETPEGHQILVDGGPGNIDGVHSSVVLEKLAHEMPFWDGSLDLIVLTHPDYDHLGGLLDVLDRYDVANILWTGVEKGTATFGMWKEKIKKENANIFIAKRGQIIKAGVSRLYIMHPFENLEGKNAGKNSNGTSIVAKLVFGENTFLLTGDISKNEEAELLVRSDSPVSLAVEVLKVPHHGSKSAGSEAFFEILAPEVAVISAGKDNTYGHPHPEVLKNLEKFGINILRTDEKGDIKITADGSDFSLL